MGLVACNTAGRNGLPQAQLGRGGYGDLIPSPDCPELMIPRGFRVIKISETLAPSKADPWFTVPQAFDGMATFAMPNGNVRLIRNHEIGDPAAVAKPLAPNGPTYDIRGGGGTTTLEVHIDADSQDNRVTLLKEFVSLSGTVVNCAGGPTPWGSWLSCEENCSGIDDGRMKPHGYVYEVPASADGPVDPVPLKAMGRFDHEAVAIDPRTGIVYLTEDIRYDVANWLPGAGFYRFIPTQPGNLAAGGRLQMLAVKGRPNYRTFTGQVAGEKMEVRWVDIEDPDPSATDKDSSAVFREGQRKGAAIFDRLEGCWYGDNSIYFDATTGGDLKLGQVWRYIPDDDDDDEGTLVLIFESSGRHVLANPDNICMTPRGGLVICEDNGTVKHIHGLTKNGTIFPIVRAGAETPEFCGACFSPDYSVLFFNTQGSTRTTGTARGRTYALWGPWRNGAL